MRGIIGLLVVGALVGLCQSVGYYYLPAATHAPKMSKNNVCLNPRDYDTIDYNDNCWYLPEADLTPVEIISRYGYPVEVHRLQTRDGFGLELFRIPHGLENENEYNKQPVFLQHGMICSSATWVTLGNRSLAFILADEGYDVWLANSRGSTYSRDHTTYTRSNPQFWNWSYEELAMYDLPDSLDKVIEINGRRDIIYVGQSLGTNLALVYASEKPQEALSKMALIVELGPTIFIGNMRTKLKMIADFEYQIKEHAEFFGIYEIAPQTPNQRRLWENICLTSANQYKLCLRIIFQIFGADYEQLLPETLPLILSHYPAGTSMKTLIHIGQNIRTDTFAKYDYGEWRNQKLYDSPEAPEYNLTEVQVPTFIMYAQNDYIATEEGATLLYERLPEEARAGLFKVQNPKFNHLDFIFARDVIKEVYDPMIEVMRQCTSQTCIIRAPYNEPVTTPNNCEPDY